MCAVRVCGILRTTPNPNTGRCSALQRSVYVYEMVSVLFYVFFSLSTSLNIINASRTHASTKIERNIARTLIILFLLLISAFAMNWLWEQIDWPLAFSTLSFVCAKSLVQRNQSKINFGCFGIDACSRMVVRLPENSVQFTISIYMPQYIRRFRFETSK